MTSKPARAQDAGLSSSTAAVKRGGAPGGCARRTRSSTSSPMQQRSLLTAREAPIVPGRRPDEHERCSARHLGRCVLDPGRTRVLFTLPLDVPWQGPYVIEKAAT